MVTFMYTQNLKFRKLKTSGQYVYISVYFVLVQIERCSLQKVELEQNCEKIEEKINELRAAKIAEIDKQAQEKVKHISEEK